MIDAIAGLLLQALESQCEGNADGLVAVRSDDLSAVEVEGCFDLRAAAVHIAGNLQPGGESGPDAPNAFVGFDENGLLQVRLVKGA